AAPPLSSHRRRPHIPDPPFLSLLARPPPPDPDPPFLSLLTPPPHLPDPAPSPPASHLPWLPVPRPRPARPSLPRLRPPPSLPRRPASLGADRRLASRAAEASRGLARASWRVPPPRASTSTANCALPRADPVSSPPRHRPPPATAPSAASWTTSGTCSLRRGIDRSHHQRKSSDFDGDSIACVHLPLNKMLCNQTAGGDLKEETYMKFCGGAATASDGTGDGSSMQCSPYTPPRPHPPPVPPPHHPSPSRGCKVNQGI
ncbi:hypothetical protein U9M48_000512, partial [Paspalum notatum var. saurae]